MAPTTHTSTMLRELAHRSSEGLDVTLLWAPQTNNLLVCVCDQRLGTYLQIRPEAHLALDVFYHPYAYASSSDLLFQDERLAA